MTSAKGTWVFDLETNGLLDRGPELTLLCAAAEEVETGERVVWYPAGEQPPRGVGAEALPLDTLPLWLNERETVSGHNVTRFDLPVLEQLFEGWRCQVKVFDTFIASRLIFGSTMWARSVNFRRRDGGTDKEQEARMPARLLNAHSLESWGYRLNHLKGEFLSEVEDVESMTYSPELLSYCMRDVSLNAKLHRYLLASSSQYGWPQHSHESLTLETWVAYYVGQMERNGVGFDDAKALELEVRLRSRQQALVTELRELFPPWTEEVEQVTPKRTQRSRKVKPGEDGYRNVMEGCPYTKVRTVEFNPSSAKHIERGLRQLYGWKPKDFGADGVATCDDETLSELTQWEAVPLVREYLLVSKRLGALSDGQNAWRKLVTKHGRIHGRCETLGTRTTRASHRKPNLAQVPASGKPWGKECRELFRPTREGWVMVGADASGLQLRALAHRLAAFDGGEFARVLLESDPHTAWQQATGLHYRRNQKTYTYAMLFGAADRKLGSIVVEDWREAYEAGNTEAPPPPLSQCAALGRKSREKLASKVVGLEQLVENCAACFARGNPPTSTTLGRNRKPKRSGFGWLRGLDGRVIPVRSEHGALNDLLQSDEAVIMKTAFYQLMTGLEGCGWVLGEDFAPLLWVHDELQFEAPPHLANVLGQRMCDAITTAGRRLGYRIELAGEYHVGASWADTH